jgi:GT2 family glycosyltransferase
MSIAVVILNDNGWEDTLECVESLQDQSHQDFRIIVVDNNSENDSYYHFIKWVNNEYLDDSEYVKNQKYINKRV